MHGRRLTTLDKHCCLRLCLTAIVHCLVCAHGSRHRKVLCRSDEPYKVILIKFRVAWTCRALFNATTSPAKPSITQQKLLRVCDRMLVVLLSLLSFALAAQPNAPSAAPAPIRPLPWGQLNFVHTTDTHGWHAGHLQESVPQMNSRCSTKALQSTILC